MTDHAAIQADYCDLRFIKSRKVCQIVVEIPIEAGGAFVAAFGTPDPSKGVPIALARIEPLEIQMQRSPNPYLKKGGKLAQRAGIICSEGAFGQFLNDPIVGMGTSTFHGEFDSDVAAALRYLCGVASRADLDHDEAAARKFLDLEASYKAWLATA